MADGDGKDDEDEIEVPPAISAEDFLDELLTEMLRGEHDYDDDHDDFHLGRAVVNAEMLGVSFFGPDADSPEIAAPESQGEEKPAAGTDGGGGNEGG
jgi:hypothetical protein